MLTKTVSLDQIRRNEIFGVTSMDLLAGGHVATPTTKLDALMRKIQMLRRDPLDLRHTNSCVT